MFLDNAYRAKNMCGINVLDELRCCVWTGIVTCPSEHELIKSELKNKNDIASRVVTIMHNLDVPTVNDDKEMSVKALNHIDVMLRKNEIDFSIIWAIKNKRTYQKSQ